MSTRQNLVKPTIAVDIDDVIAANAPAFIDYSNRKYGTRLSVNDYHERWGEVWNVDHEETLKRAAEYHDSGHIATYGIVEGASEALRQLKKRFRLVVLTTRRNSISQLTRDWIDRYYPGTFDGIVFAGFFDTPTTDSLTMTKGQLAKNIGAEYLIDDQLKHCQSASEIGIKALLFGDYPWNQSDKLPSNTTRVKNWQEVIEYFNEQPPPNGGKLKRKSIP